MAENERLTIDEIIQHCNRNCEMHEFTAIVKGQTREDITSKGYWEHYQVANYLEELKQYRAIGTIEEFKALKDAEEQGLLIKLPCKVGDTVWCLTSANTKIVECKVLWIEKHSNGVLVFALEGGLGDVVLAHLNKTWFLTKEEADQALKQMGE